MSIAPTAQTDKPTPAFPELVDDIAVAAALGTSVQRVRSMVKRGELPRPLTDGRRLKWARVRVISHLTGEISPKAEG